MKVFPRKAVFDNKLTFGSEQFHPANGLEFILLAGLLTVFALNASAAFQPFTKITEGSIVADLGSWIGCAWGDYDTDGYLDLFVANGNFNSVGELTNALYRNNRDGTFTRITEGPVATDVGDSYGGVWGDYNNDSFLDLFVANDDGQNNYLYKNKGNGTFEKITTGSVVTDGGVSRAAAWGDFDKDGWLDLFVVNGFGEADFLYRNNGDGTFTRITTGDPVSDDGNGEGCAWVDYDGDGWLDLLVTNNRGIFQYHNEGNGTLTRIVESELANADVRLEGLDPGDYDNDGHVDLFFANFGPGDLLFRNKGNGTFSVVSEGDIVSATGFGNGCTWGDHDNDADLDLFVARAGGQTKNALYENNGDGTFTRVHEGIIATDLMAETGFASSQGCAWGDYNNDGFLDLFVANSATGDGTTNFLYRNDGNGNSWIKVRCIGAKSNRSGFGVKVRVKAMIGGTMHWQMREISGGSSYASQNAPESHFGLKDATIVDTIRIEWPSGIVQELHNVTAKQILTVTESAGPTSTARPSFTGIDRLADGRARLVINGESGKTFRIEVSNNLTDWSMLQSIQITSADGTREFTDETATNATVRFYRLVLVP